MKEQAIGGFSVHNAFNHETPTDVFMTLFISGFVQPFEREIQAIFKDFRALHASEL